MPPRTQPDKAAILEAVVAILQDITRDWEVAYSGGITAKSRLVADLGFESIDIVELVVALEERFQTRTLPFDRLLMNEGRYVDEVVVSDLVDFLSTHLATA